MWHCTRSLLLVLLLTPLLGACGEEERDTAPSISEAAAFLANWAEPVGEELDEAAGYPARIRRLKDGMEMVLVPAGTFHMGAVPDDALAKEVEDEHPRHEVTLTKAFYLDVHEVTNAQFTTFAEETTHVTKPEVVGWAVVFSPEDADEQGAWVESPGASWRLPWTRATAPPDWEQHPVVLISWGDATDYCKWVGATLPSEAQFERALRGGVEGAIYPWGNSLPPEPPRPGNFQDEAFLRFVGSAATNTLPGYDDGHVRTAPVMSFAPNAYGLYDLSGNVWEWCQDGYQADAYSESPRVDPVAPHTEPGRVRRGGGWMTGTGGRLRCSWRGVADAVVCDDYMGFRCARTLP